MFKFNRFHGWLAAVGIASTALIGVQPASAGLDFITDEANDSKVQVKPTGKTRPTAINSMARIADTTPANSFKCWQDGRLIFQRKGLQVKKQKLPGAAMLKANGQTVQVLDLKQGVCILDQETK